MLSLSVPRLTALASTSTFPSHRRHFLQRKPLSVSVSTTTAKPSLHVGSFKPSHLCRRFQLAAGADSRETEEEEEEEEEEGELEVTIGGLQVEGEEFMVPEEEEDEEGEHDEEEYDEEEEGEEGEGDEEEDDEDDFASIRPPIVLKFIWMEKNIGLSLEMVLHGKGTLPLTPYYFWPRKDAWEELKAVLEEKKWVSQKRMIILLNQATDIINLWQQSGVNVPTSPV